MRSLSSMRILSSRPFFALGASVRACLWLLTFTIETEASFFIDNPDQFNPTRCFQAMRDADVDGSGWIEKDEYLTFINLYGGSYLCYYSDELTLSQHEAFNYLSCICRNHTDPTCCLLDNAKLPVAPAENSTFMYTWAVATCVETDSTLVNNCICDPPNCQCRDHAQNECEACVAVPGEDGDHVDVLFYPDCNEADREPYRGPLEDSSSLEDTLLSLPSRVLEDSLALTQCFFDHEELLV